MQRANDKVKVGEGKILLTFFPFQNSLSSSGFHQIVAAESGPGPGTHW